MNEVSNIEKTLNNLNEFEKAVNRILLKRMDRSFNEQIKLAMSTDDPVAFIHHRGVCADIAIATYEYGLFDKEALLNIVNSLMNMKFPEEQEANK